MRYMKYVVVHYDMTGEEIYLFPQNTYHQTFVEQFHHNGNVVRAGMVGLWGGRLQCYGADKCLGLMSDPDKDTALLVAQMGGE
jgi:hypothetical protein